VIGSSTDSMRRLRASKALTFLIASAMLTQACGSGASAGQPGTAGGAGTDAGGSNASQSELAGRWWGHLPNGSATVLEVAEVGNASGAPARIWKADGTHAETRLSGDASGWFFSGDSLGSCGLLKLGAAPDQLTLTRCGPNQTDTLTLRRSRATRIYEAPVKAGSLGFDSASTRFGFSNMGHFWLWDTSVNSLSDLGAGVPVSEQLPGQPPSSLVYAPDGQHVAYIRNAYPSCNVATLMLFDAASGTSEEVATGTPCAPGYARFSADSAQLVYFANDTNDGTGADLMHWSIAAHRSALIVPKSELSRAAPQLIFGSSGQRLFFRTALSPGLETPLSSYDFTTKSVTTVSATATDVAASPDGSWLAFSEANGTVRLWNDAAGSASLLDPKPDLPPNADYRSGLSVSPDGRRLAYLKSAGYAVLYDTAPAAPEKTRLGLGTGGVLCLADRTDGFPRVATFSDDSNSLLYFGIQSPPLSDCFGGSTPSTAFTWNDLAGHDVGGIPLGQAPGQFYRFGPHGQVIRFSDSKVALWTHEGGLVPIKDFTAPDVLWIGFAAHLARDGAELIFEITGQGTKFETVQPPPTNGLWAWDAATQTTTEITSALPDPGSFRYQVDSSSGQVFFLEDTREEDKPDPPLKLWTPAGGPLLTLLDSTDAQLESYSGRALAAHGTRGPDQGIFTLRLDAQEPTLIEEGTIVGISDTHIYYSAPDGVCVLAY
jgi:WD40 repeat protein